MANLKTKRKALIGAAYVYLALPICIYFIGWLKPVVSVPMTLLFVYGVFISIKNFDTGTIQTPAITKKQWFVVAIMIAVWVLLSGIGGFVWQNRFDHQFRNAVFRDLVNYDWPVVGASFPRMLVYYFGFWMPCALIGKVFGTEAGYVCQLIWALIGMGLTFCLMSYVLRKFSWVTMLVFIFFSGLDVIPFLADVFTNGYPAPDPFTGDGIFTHIELMLLRFNSSSSTTLLFWVYNQAIPFWVCFLLILLQKNNRCLLFTYSLLALFAPLPMIGALPTVVYLMLHNEKVTLHSFFKKLGPLIAHQLNVQNIAAIVQIGIIVLFYTTNISAGNIQLNPIDGPTVLSYLYFFMIEFGVFLLWLLPASLKSRLCITLMVSTMIFNFIRVGSSFDFAWRTTMMFTFFVMIFVINKLIHKWHKTRWFSKAAIILLLVAGAVTPGMEIARTVHNTRVIITEQNNPGTYAEDSYQYVISQQTLRLDYLHGLVELTDEDIENIEAYSNFLGDASDAKAFNRYLRK